MDWIFQSWKKIIKENNLDYEEYYYKDDFHDPPQGGVDIIYDNSYWIIDFWGQYKSFKYLFQIKNHLVHTSLNAAQNAVDIFLEKMFKLSLFL